MKIKSLYIDKFKGLKNFEIDFSNENSVNPITVITGINGSGKTSVLEFVYNGLLGDIRDPYGNSSLLIINDSNIFNEKSNNNTEEIKWSFGNSASIINPHTGLAILNTDLVSNNLRNTLIFYQACKENKNAEIYIKEFIDKLIYEEDIVSSEAYSKIREVINDIFKELSIQVEFDRMDKNKTIYFKNPISNNIKMEDLSGGEKTLLTKVLPLYLSDYKNGVILIDEPETSLHPNWQFQIINLYKKIAKKNNNQLIIATHSPQIVASVEQKYIKILVKEEESIKVIDSASNPYGKRIDEVLLDVFQANGLRTPNIESKLDELNILLSENKENSMEFKKLFNELSNILNGSDNDLLLIKLELARRKKRDNEKSI